jgi:hypothetical protein
MKSWLQLILKTTLNPFLSISKCCILKKNILKHFSLSLSLSLSLQQVECHQDFKSVDSYMPQKMLLNHPIQPTFHTSIPIKCTQMYPEMINFPHTELPIFTSSNLQKEIKMIWWFISFLHSSLFSKSKVLLKGQNCCGMKIVLLLDG